MNVFICFNPTTPNKATIHKQRLFANFIEFPFENALEQLENNMYNPKHQQICNGILNMTSIIEAFHKYPFSLVCLLDNEIIGIVILDIYELSLIIVYICVNKHKKLSNVGKQLMDNAIHLARCIDLKFITLHSIPSAVGFYKKMGFKFGYIDDEIDEYEDDKDDIPFDTNMFLKIGGGKKKEKQKRRTKKKNKHKRSTTRRWY